MKHIITYAGLGLAFLAVPLFAENTNTVESVSKTETKKNDSTMKEVVVSATMVPEEVGKSGSSISSVSEAIIKQRRPFQTAEVLRGEPGLEAGVEVNNATGAQGGVSQISIRGLPFSRTFVQVDGLRFNRPIDGIANLSDLPPLLTGNIEVLRGPQSSLYGSEAQGGVVSIFAPAGQGKPSVGTSFEAGTFNTRRERVFSQGKEKKFDWNMEYARLDTDQERPNNNFRQDAAAARFGYDVSEVVRLDLVSRYTDYTVGAPGGTSGFGANDPDDRLIRRTTIVSPSLTVTPFDIWESKLTLGYIGVGQRFDSAPSEFVNHSESLQLHWQNTINVADWNTFVVGGEEDNDHTTTEASSGNNVFNRATQSAFAEDNIRVDDWWGFTLSGRFDDNERFRDVFTYHASQFFKAPVTDTRLHMSFGTGFRAPVISELQPLFGPLSGANPNLIPETTEGYDVGLTQPFLDGKLEADSTYFYNDVVNLIGTDAAFVFQNLSEVRTEGVENSVKWQAFKNLNVKGAFTLTSTTSKDPRFRGLNLARSPREGASLTTVWDPIDPLELTLVYTFTGTRFNNATNTQKLAEFNTLDLYATYQITSWLKCFGRGENLLGYRYQEAAAFPAIGRAFYAGLEATY